MNIKEKFYKMIAEAGFTGLRDFSRHCGISAGNICTNLSGKYKVSIERAFIYANTLKVPIMDIIILFYPEEVYKNNDLAN